MRWQSITHGKQWVVTPRAIAKNYLKSWFALDVFAIAVSGFDIYAVVMQQLDGGSASGEDLSNLTALKTLRVLRLFKLVRLMRSSRIAKRWETRVAVDYSMMSIFKCIVGVIIASHWMACVWVLRGYIINTTCAPCGDSNASPSELGCPVALSCVEEAMTNLNPDVLLPCIACRPVASWMGEEGYCVLSPGEPGNYACQAPHRIYASALYFSVMTITSVGYGDVAATPFNAAEMAVCTFLMLTSSIIYAQVRALAPSPTRGTRTHTHSRS